MKITQRNGRAAFTLIELMAVITIIVILAGLVVGGMGFVTERQAKDKAKVQMALLSKALEEYKLEMGSYPPTDDKTAVLKNANGHPYGTETSIELYTALFYEGYDYTKQETPPDPWTKSVGGADVPKATKIYLPDLDPTVSKQGWMNSSFSGKTTPPAPINTGTARTNVVDPWGNEYCYRTAFGKPKKGSDGTITVPTNAATQNPDFDLWSMGKDGKTNPGTPADAVNRDDIKNP